ncbi:DNA repair protein RadA [Sandaracinomonas limnophila]|uniref:DNA repair protein RadA n=1 Tax=Sandaracinomonas limnophila TaxID=1862386 RepID=A0A437PXD9_9BACT|nr:DNA repair protein RadA [Sandaracinomonas limnophila]RVU26921.1 DNA repair protein RadA [Sandaracinomonas limnophila]
MAKSKTTFFCQNCGHNSPKWLGKCPSCNEWNTFVEELVETVKHPADVWKKNQGPRISPKPRLLDEVPMEDVPKINCSDNEFNRVLGGGIVPGSLVLIGGEPGIGKSTLLLQIALQLIGPKILYISGEESEQQIKLRAERLNFKNPNLYLLPETNTQQIFKHLVDLEPDLIIIDSIQTLYSDQIDSGPGSVSQIRECTVELMRYAKESGVPIFLVGHITKEGSIAGPKVLEHLVDTVLQFEGDRNLIYRILRTTKNRFGSTSELGIYEMLSEGLRPVENPSEILLSPREEQSNGIAIGTLMEGNRPLLIEIQSLVTPTNYGTAQRTATGFDAKRLNMLLAVLEKRGNYKLGTQDVFLNITGGIKVDDPALDLAACMSIVSSFKDKQISNTICFAAEVGLGGELRTVTRLDARIAEAEKLGFTEIWISKFAKGNLPKSPKIEIKQAGNIVEVIRKVESGK